MFIHVGTVHTIKGMMIGWIITESSWPHYNYYIYFLSSATRDFSPAPSSPVPVLFHYHTLCLHSITFSWSLQHSTVYFCRRNSTWYVMMRVPAIGNSLTQYYAYKIIMCMYNNMHVYINYKHLNEQKRNTCLCTHTRVCRRVHELLACMYMYNTCTCTCTYTCINTCIHM